MSVCVYYRKGRCANPGKCQYKILSKKGTLCQRDGEIGDIVKSSEHYRPISE